MSCPHNNVQQFTEICLDCGVNIYETDAERKQRLRGEIAHLRSELDKREADELETERDNLREKLHPSSDDENPRGW